MGSAGKLSVACAAAAGVTATMLLAAVQAPARDSTTPCRGSKLRGRLLDSSGAAGTLLLAVTLRNAGGTCSLRGYAGLRLARHGKPLPTRVVHGGLAPLNSRPTYVLLAHDRRATILIAYEDVPAGGERSCPSSTTILVRPPGGREWVPAAARAQACGHGTLRESPVLAGIHHAR